jgi:deoxyribodipyrimidine photo-lyase
MHTNKEEIHVVWFKRDLRLQDNEAIQNALASNKRVLFLYVFENSLIEDPHYDTRHWDFIKQSVVALNAELKKYDTKVLCVQTEVVNAFNQIFDSFKVDTVFSHQETGLLITYNRDKEFTRYCRNNSVTWKENNNNGVLRGLLNRADWFDKWDDYMYDTQIKNTLDAEQFISIEEIEQIEAYFNTVALETPKHSYFQQGGTKMAWKYADTFFQTRHEKYMSNISKPALARQSCSRLSPYLAWGNVSIRQIFQEATKRKTDANKRHLGAFISRLRWQAHFIQKFEMEHTMENASINKGYQKLKKSISLEYQKAWETGTTGFPLIDASMRCLKETGYLNFRMRAMVVSFFTHILWQPWQSSSQHLSKLFLDFEPGIHFSQLQMNAGETGINTLRIYNPIKNSIEHDEDGTFIKKWVPELANLSIAFIHEPYLMTPLDQQFNNFELGVHYPHPIVDIKIARKKASDTLWEMKKNSDVQKESERILKKHMLSDRSRMLKTE